MFQKKITLIAALSLILPFSAQASDATETMASIMIKLDHQPSVDEKKALQKIIDGSVTENERRIASALFNMDHSVRGEDKPKLRAVLVDTGASEQERTLAKILYPLEHQAKEEDKARLTALTKAGNSANEAPKKAASQKKSAAKTANKSAPKTAAKPQ